MAVDAKFGVIVSARSSLDIYIYIYSVFHLVTFLDVLEIITKILGNLLFFGDFV